MVQPNLARQQPAQAQQQQQQPIPATGMPPGIPTQTFTNQMFQAMPPTTIGLPVTTVGPAGGHPQQQPAMVGQPMVGQQQQPPVAMVGQPQQQASAERGPEFQQIQQQLQQHLAQQQRQQDDLKEE